MKTRHYITFLAALASIALVNRFSKTAGSVQIEAIKSAVATHIWPKKESSVGTLAPTEKLAVLKDLHKQGFSKWPSLNTPDVKAFEYYRSAQKLIEQGALDEAEAELQKGLQLVPHHFHANLALGEIALKKHDLKNAKAYYERAVETRPFGLKAVLGLGDAAFQLSELDKARKQYEKFLKYAEEFEPSLYAQENERIKRHLMIIGMKLSSKAG